MTMLATPTLPLDGLLVCGNCHAAMQLSGAADTALYRCPNICDTPALRARELNRLIFDELSTQLVTDESFPFLRQKTDEAFEASKQEEPRLDEIPKPDDDELRRLVADPDNFLRE